ncbi:carbohydrate sulfotransferase 11 [Aplysia californica]|uniref:Carbohydrate sulfotransferase n=1 Tax=Aplysia californica TaxID=6500 RepID=A0ABM0JHW6_APLCA|nr:carbohydrate sulfotransferase 11 [Aplysia californica]
MPVMSVRRFKTISILLILVSAAAVIYRTVSTHQAMETSTVKREVSSLDEVRRERDCTPVQKERKPDVFEDMHQRRARMLAVCEANPELKNNYANNTMVSHQHGLLYCPVPKVASTFWSRFFYQLMHTNPMKSPFDVPVVKVEPTYFRKFFLKDRPHTPELTASIHSLKTRLIFIRDPYARIYSSYVDKLIAPNPIHWKRWGTPIAQMYREGNDKITSEQDPRLCGHDATFSEWIRYTLDVAWKSDVHVMLASSMCPACLYNFTVIGKMETFIRDSLHVAAQLNISESQIGFDRMEADAAADAIEDSSKDSLSNYWLKLSTRCVTKKDVLQRILRKVQLRGFVSWRYQFNLTDEEVKNMNLKTYVEILTQARNKFYNAAELKLQKKHAFKEAYAAVSAVLIRRIADTYKIDADMFGYETLPMELMQLEHVANTHAFDHTKPWDLSGLIGG